ncbi:glucose-6-phosphate isomerase, partial [Glaesserella parasuis]|nr:glucose-6-phosphate isomerase [Glaesserella parasuis]MDE3943633.1 glucose-6-phosphate isomerase [Glaesserella parasuis]MDE3962099.1 glucose-6-phosphate isomerase [Glaesserella parasuis]MDE3971831.1 glucose-6-phosphate isomerase [Glaesserella parasuis]MDE4006371.1 glucose-6-phosphate isomerase [Glaesserella parasuis]
MQNINPTQTFAWNALEQHKAENLTIPQLFNEDPKRFDKYSLRFEDQILVDFSKNAINQHTLS